MAKRKRKHSRRRRGMADGMASKVRRRRSTRKGGLLSASAFNSSNLMASGREIVGGGIGGFIGGKLYHYTASYSPFQKLLAFGGTAMASHMFGYKNMASGIAGAYGFAVATGQPGMSEGEMEDNEFADDDALSEMADGMDESGNPMFLAADGNYYYMHELEEGEMEEDEMEEDESMSAQLLASSYPDYVNVSGY